MIALEDLRRRFSYNPETGIFTRLVQNNSNALRGEIAGHIDRTRGYMFITISGKRYRAHRLAWFYIHGYWPLNEIDHINGNRSDNRLCNLREATRAENSQNLRRARSRNFSTGVLGVSFCKPVGKFRARLEIDGKEKCFGYFKTIDEASAAYEAGKRKYHRYFVGTEKPALATNVP